MTVKEASEKFNIPKEKIRELCRDSQNGPIVYIKANKNIRWYIDDDTKIIMTKDQIFYSLLQLLKYKNNSNYVISHRTFSNDNISTIIFDYLCDLGYVSKRGLTVCSLIDCLNTISLTEEGINALLNPMQKKRCENAKPVKFSTNINVNINSGLVNLAV